MAEGSSTSTTPKGTVRRRNPGQAKEQQRNRSTGSNAGSLRLYTDDTPGLRVDPLTVLVLSLVFIGSVFSLHIYGKLTRA